jgi:hypothetical protein
MLNLKEAFGERYRISWDPARKAGGWTKAELPWLMWIEGESGYISLWQAEPWPLSPSANDPRAGSHCTPGSIFP